jgi:putative ABC transport system permease protein
MSQTSITLALLAMTGALAFMLGVIGVYGVVAYAASQRRSEIGLRLALGAGYGHIRRMFVRQAIVLVTIGVAIGLGVASVVTKVIESRLYGVTPLDPATHVAVVIALLAAAALASYVSAWRGTSLDPVVVLRAD